MVTVMVTFFNQKKYIFDSLNSIFNQKTNFKYEVICGDDGSTDGTYEELLIWKNRYPDICTVLQMPRELGKKYEPIVRVSNNRHNMLKNARGKYVLFLDGDDYFTDPYKLQKQVELLEEYSDCIACGHPVTMVWDNIPEKKQEICRISDECVRIKKEVYWAYSWLHADTLLFKNIYKGKEDSINKDFFDDNLITCYFIKYGDVIYMPQSMVAYRQITESSWNMRDDLQKMLVNMWAYVESKKVVPEMSIQCFMRWCFAWVWFYKNRKRLNKEKDSRDYSMYGKIVRESIEYNHMNMINKIWYEVKYFIPIHMEKIINKVSKVKHITYQKI